MSRLLLVYLCLTFVGPSPFAWGQSAGDDDDRRPRPAEPGFRLINLPTTLPLPRHGGNFELTHRFNGNLRQGDFGDQAADLFGIDRGAAVGFEYRYAVVRHVQAAVYRTTFDKTFQFHGRYDAIRQRGSMPLALSAIVSIEGTTNFTRNRAPAVGATISRALADRAAVYATPLWVHNSAAAAGVTRDTFLFGVGGRLRISPSILLVAEVSPRLAGYRPGRAAFGIGVEKRAGKHLFQLNVANTQGTTYAQVARGGFADTLYFGFNLVRKFY